MTDITFLWPYGGVPALPAMTDVAIGKVHEMEKQLLQAPQVDIATRHVLHGGMYARTITIPSGVLLTGALIKLPTVLVLSGHATVYIGDGTIEIEGHHVIPASAGRKQAFYAHTNTDLTMLFPTHATTIEQAEAEFTDEADRLMSRVCGNDICITGE